MATPTGGIEWRCGDALVPYPDAVAAMEERVAAIRSGSASELVWLLEHPPLYTAGTSADPSELLDPAGLPVYRSGRGGRYTFHGPGQRIAYVLLDLDRRGRDVRCHVWRLEAWIIRALARFNVRGERRPDRIGVWVGGGDRGDEKIAAIGVRVRHWVTFHGIALNVDPDLTRFRGIVPCGVREAGVTSLAKLGVIASPAEIDAALHATFDAAFAETPACLA